MNLPEISLFNRTFSAQLPIGIGQSEALTRFSINIHIGFSQNHVTFKC